MSAQAAGTTPARRGPRYEAPSAVGSDLRRFWNLLITLSVTDFKLVYFGSALGYVWSLMRPLLMFAVLYVVFTRIVRVGTDVPNYPVYLLMGLVLFGYFRDATGAAVTSLVDRENLLRKVHFPRLVIPLSVSLTQLFHLAMNMIAVVVFFAVAGVEPRWSWLQLPFLIGVIVVLTLGCSMLISALYVRYRDMSPIWEVFLQLGFWASPIIYAIGAIPEQYREPLSYSPIASVLNQMRHAVIDPNAPTAAELIGGGWKLAIPAAMVVGIFVVGTLVFRREAPRIAENL